MDLKVICIYYIYKYMAANLTLKEKYNIFKYHLYLYTDKINTYPLVWWIIKIIYPKFQNSYFCDSDFYDSDFCDSDFYNS